MLSQLSQKRDIRILPLCWIVIQYVVSWMPRNKILTKKTRRPDVERLSSGSTAQLASQKRSRVIEGLELGFITSHVSRVPAMYLRILFTACQCVSRGF